MAAPTKARSTTKKAKITPISESNGNARQASNETFEELVRRRAYEIYEASGRPDGRAHEHWLQAEAEIRGRKSA